MIITSSYLSVITLNISGLYSPIKRHRMTELIKKKKEERKNKKENHDPIVCYLQETHFSFKSTHRLRVSDEKSRFK